MRLGQAIVAFVAGMLSYKYREPLSENLKEAGKKASEWVGDYLEITTKEDDDK